MYSNFRLPEFNKGRDAFSPPSHRKNGCVQDVFFSGLFVKKHKMSMRLLSESDLPQIMDLQTRTVRTLTSTQKNALVPKSKNQFRKRMSQLGMMLGVFDEESGQEKGGLIAYGVLALPCPEWSVADMVLPKEKLFCASESLAVIQNNVVRLDYRERGINTYLIKARLEVCKAISRPHVMAEVSVHNPASLKGFLKLGFFVDSSGVDPDDGCKLFFVHKNVNVNSSISEKNTLAFDPVAEFDEVQELLCKGYKGTSIQRVGKTEKYILNLEKPTP